MGLRLFFLTNFLGAMFIQGATFIPDSRLVRKFVTMLILKARFNKDRNLRRKKAASCLGDARQNLFDFKNNYTNFNENSTLIPLK